MNYAVFDQDAPKFAKIKYDFLPNDYDGEFTKIILKTISEYVKHECKVSCRISLGQLPKSHEILISGYDSTLEDALEVFAKNVGTHCMILSTSHPEIARKICGKNK
jgi:hypothetical protein